MAAMVLPLGRSGAHPNSPNCGSWRLCRRHWPIPVPTSVQHRQRLTKGSFADADRTARNWAIVMWRGHRGSVPSAVCFLLRAPLVATKKPRRSLPRRSCSVVAMRITLDPSRRPTEAQRKPNGRCRAGTGTEAATDAGTAWILDPGRAAPASTSQPARGWSRCSSGGRSSSSSLCPTPPPQSPPPPPATAAATIHDGAARGVSVVSMVGAIMQCHVLPVAPHSGSRRRGDGFPSCSATYYPWHHTTAPPPCASIR
mmetsp:Transcript_25972/g.60808  ORF Transcript_25972/g.60808 Transcript_25972/m.60808 type:complete len:255 (-) Transcript_25972:224-988(-)